MTQKITEKAFVIGFGRFGRLLFDIIKHDFCVNFFDESKVHKIDGSYQELADGLIDAKYIFLCVPIRNMQNVIAKIAPLLQSGAVIIDVCSVKVKPCEWMLEGLPDFVDIIATHPMFGPDSFNIDEYSNKNVGSGIGISVKSNSKMQVIMHSVRSLALTNNSYDFIKSYFESKSFKILEMTPSEHDKAAAYTQGLTHFLGRVLGGVDINHILHKFNDNNCDIPVTKGFMSLMEVREQTCNDSMELFEDMMKFNPYSQKMLDDIKISFDKFIGLF